MSKPNLDMELENAMMEAMGNPRMRMLLWHIVVVFLYTFDPSYAHNATAYSLLAKKEAGLRILDWMKRVSPEGAFRAESEYNNLANNEQGGGENG